MCLEEKLDDLYHFREWVFPRLTDFEIEIWSIKTELKKIRAEDQGVQSRAAVRDVRVYQPSSPITPATDSYQRRSETKKRREEAPRRSAGVYFAEHVVTGQDKEDN